MFLSIARLTNSSNTQSLFFRHHTQSKLLKAVRGIINAYQLTYTNKIYVNYNRNNFTYSLVARNSYLLHHRWIHTHSPCRRYRYDFDKSD